MKAIGISSSGRKNAYSKIIIKDILDRSGIDYEMINLASLNIKAQNQAKAIGKMLGSILNARPRKNIAQTK